MMSLSNEKRTIVSSPALEAFPIVTQIMSSCSCFDVQMLIILLFYQINLNQLTYTVFPRHNFTCKIVHMT